MRVLLSGGLSTHSTISFSTKSKYLFQIRVCKLILKLVVIAVKSICSTTTFAASDPPRGASDPPLPTERLLYFHPDCAHHVRLALKIPKRYGKHIIMSRNSPVRTVMLPKTDPGVWCYGIKDTSSMRSLHVSLIPTAVPVDLPVL